MDLLERLWTRAAAVAPLPPAVVAGAAVVALVVVASPGLWRPTRTVVTIAHEGAHGLAALATGRRLAGIRLHSDTSGLTVSAGRPTGPGMVLTCAAGYVGPALFGLGAAALLAAGHAAGVLWAGLALLALLLLQIRNFFGLWAVLATGAVVAGATAWLPAAGQAAFAAVVTWFLLLAAPRTVLELQGARRPRRAPHSHPAHLATRTRQTALLWGVLLVL
ncbi:M50 family metallopeptidase [Geodermatophilus sp. SYSU D00814]